MTDKESAIQILKFPDGFLWGAAASAYQTEGGNQNCDWWEWERSAKRELALRSAGKNPRDYYCGQACDFWNRFDEDFVLARGLNHNAIRFGIEWSRVEPQEGVFDQVALDRYEKILQSAKARGLKVFLTLHHFTNPLWFAKKGGFAKKSSADDFARYAAMAAGRFSRYVDFWITINEPNAYAGHAYLLGNYPPQQHSLRKAFNVANNLIHAHNRAAEILKSKTGKPVSLAFQMANWESDGLFSGAAKYLAEYLASGYIFNRVISHCDYIGVNYYNQLHVGLFGLRTPANKSDEQTDLGWGIHPRGLERVLLRLKKYAKPIYVTENGLADAKDSKREKYIKEHLFRTHCAIARGVDVRGYLYWALTDNFEWLEGFWPRFGLIEIDRAHDLKRAVRPSAYKYAEICKNNALAGEFAKAL